MVEVIKLFFTGYPFSIKQRFTWLIQNLRFGSFFRKRHFKKSHLDSGENLWSTIRKHFFFVSEFYPVANILKAPVICATMFDRHTPKHAINDKLILETMSMVALEWGDCFNETKEVIESWLSIFGATMERAEQLAPDFPKKMRSSEFIEFGPGLGGAAQLYSRYYNARGTLFDLPEVTNLRSIIYRALSRKKNTHASFEQFTNFDELSQKVKKTNKINFISTWAFTESPMEVRESFFEILNSSQTIMIISNAKFGEIDNFAYLKNLEQRLQHHIHISCDLSYLEKAPGYQKRHQLHIFVQKDY